MSSKKKRLNKKHPFHLVSPSPWPVYMSISLFSLTFSGALTMHQFANSYILMYLSMFLATMSMALWFRDIISESIKLKSGYLKSIAPALNKKITLPASYNPSREPLSNLNHASVWLLPLMRSSSPDYLVASRENTASVGGVGAPFLFSSKRKACDLIYEKDYLFLGLAALGSKAFLLFKKKNKSLGRNYVNGGGAGTSYRHLHHLAGQRSAWRRRGWVIADLPPRLLRHLFSRHYLRNNNFSYSSLFSEYNDIITIITTIMFVIFLIFYLEGLEVSTCYTYRAIDRTLKEFLLPPSYEWNNPHHLWGNLDLAVKKLKIVFFDYRTSPNNLPIIIIIITIVVGLITFVITNIKIIIISILSYVFIKCLFLNFYQKHFKFKTNRLGAKQKLLLFLFLLKAPLEKKKELARKFFKIVLVLIPIKFISRSLILLLLSGCLAGGDISYTIVAVMLSLPYIYYILNIIKKKYIKNQLLSPLSNLNNPEDYWGLKKKDYLLFNNNVINNVNLYNIFLMLLTLFLIKYYYFYYMVIVVTSVALIGLVLVIFDLQEYIIRWLQHKQVDQSVGIPQWVGATSVNKGIYERINLRAVISMEFPGSLWILATAFYGIHLGEAAECGYDNSEIAVRGFDTEKVANKYDRVKLLPNNLDGHRGETINWIHYTRKYFFNSEEKADWDKKKLSRCSITKIINSPILRMVYAQSRWVNEVRHEYHLGALNNLTYFENGKYMGSVGKLGEETLVVNILRADNLNVKPKLLPTHYILNYRTGSDDNSLAFYPIESARNYLREKHGIFIPFNTEQWTYKNIIVLTEKELLAGTDGFFRILRAGGPTYTDLGLRFKGGEYEHYQCGIYEDINVNVNSNAFLKKYRYIREIKFGAGNMKEGLKIQEDTDKKLNQLYGNYFSLRRFNKHISTIPNPHVVPEIPQEPANWISRIFMHQYIQGNLPKFILYRKSDLNLVWDERCTAVLIPISTDRARENLLEDMMYHENNYYAISVSGINFDLLYVDHHHSKGNDLFYYEMPKPTIYSIFDDKNQQINPLYYPNRLTHTQTYNILKNCDGASLARFLLYV